MVCKGVFNQVIWKKKRELHEAYLTRNWIKVKPFWYARNLCGNYEKRLSYLEIFFGSVTNQKWGEMYYVNLKKSNQD